MTDSRITLAYFSESQLPLPKFTKKLSGIRSRSIPASELVTSAALTVPASPPPISITLQLDGKAVTWSPERASTGNLQGTTRTLDGARRRAPQRGHRRGTDFTDGWALVDDAGRYLIPLIQLRTATPQASRGCCHGPRARGRISTSSATVMTTSGLWATMYASRAHPAAATLCFRSLWSRYWAYSDQELRDLVTGFSSA